MMPKPKRASAQLWQILGDIDDRKIFEILDLPTLELLEQPAKWAGGEGEIVRQAAHPLTGRAAEIFDILRRGGGLGPSNACLHGPVIDPGQHPHLGTRLSFCWVKGTTGAQHVFCHDSLPGHRFGGLYGHSRSTHPLHNEPPQVRKTGSS
jgi:hypothetical protein